MILSSKMGCYSYFERSSKKNLSRNLGGKRKSRSKNLEKTSNILIQQINSNQLERFLVYWAVYNSRRTKDFFQPLKKIKFARDDEARAKIPGRFGANLAGVSRASAD